jgi:hypothetical protein
VITALCDSLSTHDRREIIMTAQPTVSKANVELVRAGFEAFNAGAAERCLATTTPDLIINRVTDGLIAEEWICSDMATLFRQLS